MGWTAPETNNYSLVSSFVGADEPFPTSTDVHVLLNSSSLFSEFVNGFGAPSTKSFSTIFSLNAGDNIDFVLGYGSNGTYSGDITGIEANITTGAVPFEFSPTLGILAVGGLFASSCLLKCRKTFVK